MIVPIRKSFAPNCTCNSHFRDIFKSSQRVLQKNSAWWRNNYEVLSAL